MKRKAAIFILLVLIILSLAGCSNGDRRPERQITGQMPIRKSNGKNCLSAYYPCSSALCGK